jgi:hypothetical protein
MPPFGYDVHSFIHSFLWINFNGAFFSIGLFVSMLLSYYTNKTFCSKCFALKNAVFVQGYVYLLLFRFALRKEPYCHRHRERLPQMVHDGNLL